MDSHLYNSLRASLAEKAESDAKLKDVLREVARQFVGAVNSKIDADPLVATTTGGEFKEGKYHFTVVIRFARNGKNLMDIPINFTAEKSEVAVVFTCSDSPNSQPWKTVQAGDLNIPAAYLPVVDLIEEPLKAKVEERLRAPLGAV